MRTILFTKAEGAQNDFLLIDDRDSVIPVDERKVFTRAACHRRKGIGADGTIVIERSAVNDFTMAFYNPDGSDGSMCGNGGRCAALYAYTHQIAHAEMAFDVLGQTYRAYVDGDKVRLFFPAPRSVRTNLLLEVNATSVPYHYVHNGAPHVVIFLEEIPDQTTLDALDMHALGKAIRWHASFQPEGCNVNVISIADDGATSIRTFEKGVEAETEACGTGNLAAGIIAYLRHKIMLPIVMHTHGGDVLTVGFEAKAQSQEKSMNLPIDHSPEIFAINLFLEGPAHLVFDGALTFDPTTGEMKTAKGSPLPPSPKVAGVS